MACLLRSSLAKRSCSNTVETLIDILIQTCSEKRTHRTIWKIEIFDVILFIFIWTIWQFSFFSPSLVLKYIIQCIEILLHKLGQFLRYRWFCFVWMDSEYPLKQYKKENCKIYAWIGSSEDVKNCETNCPHSPCCGGTSAPPERSGWFRKWLNWLEHAAFQSVGRLAPTLLATIKEFI